MKTNRSAVVGAWACLPALLLLSCSAPERSDIFQQPDAERATMGRPALDRLRALARDEAGAPPRTTGAMRALAQSLPAGPAPESGPDADQPLAAAIAHFAALPAQQTPPDPAPAPRSEADRRAALGAYAAGRSALLTGDADAAMDALERATALDPDAPETWRALAEAQLELGLRASAMVSLERAERLGLDEPRALTLAGLDALSRRQPDRAARLLARAERSAIPDADDGMRIVRRAGLAEALLENGRLRAGADLLTQTLDLPASLGTVTRANRELGTLFRRRPELWIRAGEAYAALGRDADADAAFASAIDLPGADTAAIAARRLALAINAGRPARAASLLMGRIAEADGLVTDRDIALVRALADAAEGELSTALAGTASELIAGAERPAPTPKLGLARIYAASQPPRERRATLLSLMTDPDFAGAEAFTALADDLFLTVPPADTQALVDLADDAVREHPLGARHAARAAYLRSSEPAALMTRAARSGSPVLRDALLLEAGRPREIDTALSSATGAEALRAAHHAILSEAASVTGRWDDALAHADAIGPAYPIVKAGALAEAQRFDAALETIADATEPLEAPHYLLLASADIALLAGVPGAAVEDLERVLTLDPANEAAFERLLAIRSNTGPLQDANELNDLARRLRDIQPDGRLIRALTARELLGRNLLGEAAQRLDDLAAEDPLDPATLEQSIQLAQSPARPEGTLDRLIARYSAILEDSPGAIGVVNALAAVHTIREDLDSAIEVVRAAIDATESPALQPLLEGLLRQAGQTAEADELRATRLRLTPRSIAQSLELAQLIATDSARWAAPDAQGGTPGRVRAVLSAIPTEARLTDAQRAAVAGAVARVIAALPREPAIGDLDPMVRREALDLIAWAIDRGAPTTAALHDRRLGLMVEAGASVDALIGAVRTGADAHPEAGPALVGRAAAGLRNELRNIDAARLVASLNIMDDPVVPEDNRGPLTFEILRLAGLSADTDGTKDLIDWLDQEGLIPTVLAAANAVPESGPGREGPAALAYTLGAFAGTFAEPDDARPFYWLALTYDPTHAWTANDLGYGLLDAGENLDEASRLIETAASQVTDRASIIDSLGWLRYHQRRLADDPDLGPEGPLQGLGAVSLLKKAVDLIDPESDDGLVREHLGDALARAGDLDAARDAWTSARTQALAALRRMNAQGSASDRARLEASDLLRRVATKLDALANDREPPTPEPFFPPEDDA